MGDATIRVKTLRYQIMLALYLPILLYAMSTFDIEEDTAYFRSIESIVVGQDNMVLGQTHQAGAYLAAAPTEYEIESLDELLRVEEIEDEDGRTRSVLRMDTGNLLEEGQNERDVTYQALLTYTTVDGEQATEEIEGGFTVRRPEVIGQTVAADAIYRQVRNEVRIQVPGLEGERLRLEAAGQSAEGTTLQLSPSSGESIEVMAYLIQEDGDDVPLGSQEFGIIDPPNPSLNLADQDGQRIDAGDRIGTSATVTFNVEPDAEFASRYSADANYEVGEVEVLYQDGIGFSRLGTFQPDANGQLNLRNELQQQGALSGGVNLAFRVNSVNRINHAGTRIPVPIEQMTSSFNASL